MIGPKLAPDAVTQTKIKDGAVSIAKLKSDKVVDTTVSVKGHSEPTYVSIETRSDHAFYLISVFPNKNDISATFRQTQTLQEPSRLRW